MLLQSRGQASVQEINRFLGRKNSFSIIKLLLEKNAILIEEQIKESYKPKILPFVRLNEEIAGEEQIRICLESLSRAKKQEQLFQFFFQKPFFLKKGKRKSVKRNYLADREFGSCIKRASGEGDT